MSKYEAIKSKEEAELKKIAIDIYNNEIYTCFMMRENNMHHIKMVFMPLLFMGPQPPFTGDVDVAKQRANRIWEILHHDNELEEFNNNFIKSIGMVYEYYTTNGHHNTFPRSLNGMPLFQSCRFLNIEDTDKLRTYLEKYAELRKEIDNF